MGEITVAPAEVEHGPAPPEPTDRRRSLAQRRVVSVLAIAAAPVVILVVLRTSPYFRLNNGDPFIYVGYANDFRGHVFRFGYTYYAVRWGLILPLRLALVLGPFWGYFLLRYVLYQLALVPLWFALRPYGRRIALFGVIAFVANPVTAQSILSTYHDSVAVPALTAVASLAVVAARTSTTRRVVLCAVAGVVVGVALNANLFFLPFGVLPVAVLCVSSLLARRIVDAFASAGAFLVAIVVVSVLGVIAYNALFHDPDIYGTTLDAMNDLSGEAVWRSPTMEWLATRRYVYAPYVVLVVGVLALLRGGPRSTPRLPFVVAFATVVATLGLFALHQFALEGNSMEHAYYFAYAIGPVCLLLAASAAELTADRGPSWLLVVAPVPLAFVTQLLELRRFWMFLVIAVAALAAMVVIRTAGAALLLGMAVMHIAWAASPRHDTILAPGAFHYEPHYETVFGDADDTAFEAYMLANELTRIVPTDGDIRRPVLFWYATGDAMLDSVQASYLWELTTVQRAPHPGMPILGPEDAVRVAGIVTGYLVLLARTTEEIEAGHGTLVSAGYGIELVSSDELTYDDSTVHALVLRVLGAPA